MSALASAICTCQTGGSIVVYLLVLIVLLSKKQNLLKQTLLLTFERKLRTKRNILTSLMIVSASHSILRTLPTTGANSLWDSKSSILSNTMPSSIRMADKLAAWKHLELIDFNPPALLYSSTFWSEASQLYNAAMSLRLLCNSWH